MKKEKNLLTEMERVCRFPPGYVYKSTIDQVIFEGTILRFISNYKAKPDPFKAMILAEKLGMTDGVWKSCETLAKKFGIVPATVDMHYRRALWRSKHAVMANELFKHLRKTHG